MEGAVVVKDDEFKYHEVKRRLEVGWSECQNQFAAGG